MKGRWPAALSFHPFVEPLSVHVPSHFSQMKNTQLASCKCYLSKLTLFDDPAERCGAIDFAAIVGQITPSCKTDSFRQVGE